METGSSKKVVPMLNFDKFDNDSGNFERDLNQYNQSTKNQLDYRD